MNEQAISDQFKRFKQEQFRQFMEYISHEGDYDDPLRTHEGWTLARLFEAVKLLDDLWFDVCQGLPLAGTERDQRIYDFLQANPIPKPERIDTTDFHL